MTKNAPWPFARLSRAEWLALGPLQVVVEDVAVQKARQLLGEMAAAPKPSGADPAPPADAKPQTRDKVSRVVCIRGTWGLY